LAVALPNSSPASAAQLSRTFFSFLPATTFLLFRTGHRMLQEGPPGELNFGARGFDAVLREYLLLLFRGVRLVDHFVYIFGGDVCRGCAFLAFFFAAALEVGALDPDELPVVEIPSP
jgi:hypothetical protein